jgi:hypothetical protein
MLIARLIDLRNTVVISPYGLGDLAGDFLTEHVTEPTREMDGLLREVLRDGRLGREDWFGCQELARTVRNVGGWCGLFRRFDCGPLEAEVVKLTRHNALLRRLQQTYSREFANNQRR